MRVRRGPILKDVSREGTAELRRVAFVVGTTAGGTGAHVRMLAAGLARRGMAVSVFGPASAAAVLGVASLPGVGFTPVEFGDRPRPGDAAAVLRLRRALRAAPPGVVHAHGLRAGALTVLALAGARARAVGARRSWSRCTTPRRTAGERPSGCTGFWSGWWRAARTSCCACRRTSNGGCGPQARAGSAGRSFPRRTCPPRTQPASAASAAGAPIVFAAGRLAPQKGFGVLLEAAARWRDLEPAPLLVIAGDGPLAGELRARAAALGVRAEFPGRRDDIPALLASAAVFVLPSLWEGQPLVLQEALRAGVPVVATHAGGIPDLTGDDAALLVPPGDAVRLADAVRSVLRDPALGTRLRAAARERGAALPSEDDAVAAVLACYADVARVLCLGY